MGTGRTPGRAGKARALLETALVTLDEARDIVVFRHCPEWHSDWSKIAPPRLLELTSESAVASREAEKLSKGIGRLRHAVFVLERESTRNDGTRLGGPRLTPEAKLHHARNELRAYEEKLAIAKKRGRQLKCELDDPGLADLRQQAVDGWLLRHTAKFRLLHKDYVELFELFENDLAGLPRQQRREFGRWSGASVAEVLRKAADQVVEVLAGRVSASDTLDISSYREEMRDLLRIELASLVREVLAEQASASPARQVGNELKAVGTRTRSRGKKVRDWSPSSEPSVLRFVQAARDLGAARPTSRRKKEPLALAGIYAQAGLTGESQTRAKRASMRLGLVSSDYRPTAEGLKLLKAHAK